MKKRKKPKAYLIGGGIASLSATFFLLEDGKIPGKNITIFEKTKKIGGSLDGEKEKKSYVIRGHRILSDKVFECTFKLFSRIPSLENPNKNIKEEIIEFNKKIKTYAKARLIEKGKIVDAHSLGLSQRDRFDLLMLLFRTEKSIQNLRINKYFGVSFFKTNFWLEFCTVFAFQPWHSLAEFRRYVLRSFHSLSFYDTLECIMSTPYNQHDSVVVPLLHHLKKKGVVFKKNHQIIDLEFIKNKNSSKVGKLLYKKEDQTKKLKINNDDLVIATLGSMTANSSLGSNNRVPKTKTDKKSPSWSFWRRISKKQSDFGNPNAFDDHINRSKWESFSLTFQDSFFFDLMEKLTGNAAGTGGGSTFKNSNWLMSITIPHQPHFINQPKKIFVCWGYGLSSDSRGNFVKKKMSDCSGKEIITELCGHLGFQKHQKRIQESAICIPCMMPYITSQFSLRKKEDRPQIIPKSTKNLAFIGQYCEIPGDVSFTVEYSVRSAQMAVYSLLNLKKKIPPIYKGYRNPKDIFKAAKTFLR